MTRKDDKQGKKWRRKKKGLCKRGGDERRTQYVKAEKRKSEEKYKERNK